MYINNTNVRPSPPSIQKNKMSKQSQVSFKGTEASLGINGFQEFVKIFSKIPIGILRLIDPKEHNMTIPVISFFTFGIVLGARLIQARDKNERREVATRDFAAIATIVFAIPVLQKSAATLIRKLLGVPTAFNSKKFIDHLRPVNGVMSAEYEHLTEWFSKIRDLPKELYTFCKHMDSNGGDLWKIFHFLDDKGIKDLNTLAVNAGKSGKAHKNLNIGEKFFRWCTKKSRNSELDLNLVHDNKEIMKLFKEAYDKEDTLQKSIIANFDNTAQEYAKKVKEAAKTGADNALRENKLHSYAEILKSVPGILNIAITAGFLGWFLPWFNIYYTKKLYKNHPEQVTGHQQAPTQTNQANVVTNIRLNSVQQKLFAEFKR